MQPPIEINNKSKLWRKHKEAEKAARREVMPGFPITQKFTSPAEVHAYLHGDRITCLLCGRAMGGLAGHLAVHGVSADEYRDMYGLPYRCGLTSSGAKEKLAAANANASEAVKAAKIARLKDPEIRARCLSAATRQRTSHHKHMLALEKVESMPPPTPKFDASDAAVVIAIMERDGVTLKDALNVAGSMKATAFRELLEAHPEIAERYGKISGEARQRNAVGNTWGRKKL